MSGTISTVLNRCSLVDSLLKKYLFSIGSLYSLVGSLVSLFAIPNRLLVL